MERKTTGNIATIAMPGIGRLLLVVALTAIMAGSAWASRYDDVTLRGDTVITAEVLTVGDVFDGTGRFAGHVLAPAPALGSSVTLTTQDLTRISEAFGFGWKPQTHTEQAVIRREATMVDRYQIEAALQEKLADALYGRKYEMVLHNRDAALFLPAGAEASVAVEDFAYNPQGGTFTAVIVAGDLRREISGRVDMMAQVPVLHRGLRAGDIIRAEDILYVDMRARDVSGSIITDAAQLVGQTPRRGLPAMQAVAIGDVMQPVLIKKGDIVTLTLDSGTMQLTAQARAMENGGQGQLVRVMNMSSRQILDATVTGPQAARVSAGPVNTIQAGL